MIDETKGVAVLLVCDGIGGANAGNLASKLAAEVFIDHIQKSIDEHDDISSQRDISAMMTYAVLVANTAVFNKSVEDEEFSGMGTTLTAAVSAKCGEVVANVGDSRLYYITKSEITQITKDHSIVEDMIDNGEITRNEARRHPNRNLITRALGNRIYEPPDIFLLNLSSGEYLLLCSDGLSDVVLDSEILFELQHSKSVRKSCKNLMDMALKRGAPDNVTVAILKKQEDTDG